MKSVVLLNACEVTYFTKFVLLVLNNDGDGDNLGVFALGVCANMMMGQLGTRRGRENTRAETLHLIPHTLNGNLTVTTNFTFTLHKLYMLDGSLTVTENPYSTIL